MLTTKTKFMNRKEASSTVSRSSGLPFINLHTGVLKSCVVSLRMNASWKGFTRTMESSCTVRARGVLMALDSNNGNEWLALPCPEARQSQHSEGLTGVTKRDASRWGRSNPQPLHALCLVRPLSWGGKLRNLRPASKVAYATTDIVFNKRFYKNPSGVQSATQNLHNKGKPARMDTQAWLRGFRSGVWLSVHELTLRSIWPPEAWGRSMAVKG